jgi:hypothetical protein
MNAKDEAGFTSTVEAQNVDHLPDEETLASDERPTPTWLSLVGLVLALTAIVAFLAKGSDEAKEGESGVDKGASPAAVASPSPSPEPPPAAAPRRPSPPPQRAGGCGQQQPGGCGQQQPGGCGQQPPQPRPRPQAPAGCGQ